MADFNMLPEHVRRNQHFRNIVEMARSHKKEQSTRQQFIEERTRFVEQRIREFQQELDSLRPFGVRVNREHQEVDQGIATLRKLFQDIYTHKFVPGQDFFLE